MTQRTLSVLELLDALGHEERALKNIGLFAQADGVRVAITRMLKLSDETPSGVALPPSLEESPA